MHEHQHNMGTAGAASGSRALVLGKLHFTRGNQLYKAATLVSVQELSALLEYVVCVISARYASGTPHNAAAGERTARNDAASIAENMAAPR